MPFFKSFVVATAAKLLDLEEFPIGRRERFGAVRADENGVFDADTAAAGEVDAGLHRHGNAVFESSRARPRDDEGLLVDLEPDPVSKTVHQPVTRSSDQPLCEGIQFHGLCPDERFCLATLLDVGHRRVKLTLPVLCRTADDRARHVRVVTRDFGSEVHLGQIAALERSVGRLVVRDR
jgi:hypothetical protein